MYKQWQVIKEARPSVLFIRSDGPRPNAPGDAQKISESRRITEDIDWDCTVHRLYFEKNQGLYAMIKQGDDFVWQNADRCLFLEDDQIPAVSAFRFCAELLEKYKDDLRVGRIVLSLWGEAYQTGDGDYFFAKSAASSGTAMWRRSARHRGDPTAYARNAYAMRSVKSMPRYLRRQFLSYARRGVYSGHAPSFEFDNRFCQYFQSQLNILPCRPLVSNHGVGDGATHSGKALRALPGAIRKLYFIKTRELAFPLRHPQFVIEDKAYLKLERRYLGTANAFTRAARSLSRLLSLLLAGDFSRMIGIFRRRTKNSVER